MMGSVYVYFTVIISAVALASAALYDPEERSGFRFALGIILAAALFDPAIRAVKGLSSIELEYADMTYESSALPTTLEGALCDGIRESISNEFSIKEDKIEVEAVGFDPETVRADMIIVTLKGGAVAENLLAVEDFVSGLGVGKCVLEAQIG